MATLLNTLGGQACSLAAAIPEGLMMARLFLHSPRATLLQASMVAATAYTESEGNTKCARNRQLLRLGQ